MRLAALLAVAVAAGALAFAPAAFADDDDDDDRRQRYRGERSYVVYDHLGRAYEVKRLREDRRWRDRYDDDDDDDDDDGRRYRSRGDQRGYYGRLEPEVVVLVGEFFDPAVGRALRQAYGARYVRYSDYGRWDRPYYVGRPLPRGLGYGPVDHQAYRYLPPPPAGHGYVGVGQDVVLLSPEGIVIDALLRLANR